MSEATLKPITSIATHEAYQILHELHEGDSAPLSLLETRLTWRMLEAKQREQLLYEAGRPFMAEARAATAELEFLQGLVALVDAVDTGIIKASNILYALEHPNDYGSRERLAELETAGAR